MLGVHAAIAGKPGEQHFPLYIERDVDGEPVGLRAQIVGALDANRFFVLVGESSVGKTRTAYEVLLSLVPHWMVLRPIPIQATCAAPTPKTIVWLDNLHRHLTGPSNNGCAEAIRTLLSAPGPNLIVGTAWPRWFAEYMTAEPTAGEDQARTIVRDVLGLASVLRVSASLSSAELDRAALVGLSDSRISVAIRLDGGFGVIQALAAVPQLMSRWHDSDPCSKAVIVPRWTRRILECGTVSIAPYLRAPRRVTAVLAIAPNPRGIG